MAIQYIISFTLAIIFLIFHTINKDETILFTNTYLGKAFIVLYVIYCSQINWMFGLTILLLIVLYYKLYGIDTNDIYKYDFLEGVDIIYWINLKRSDDRRIKMEKMFQDPIFSNIYIERINATDGKKDKIFEKLDLNEIRNTKLEYACLLSHLESIRKFSKTNNEIALIMEDDSTLEFRQYWKKTVKEIMDNAPSDWEIIQLCYNTTATLRKEYTLNSNYGNATKYGNVACLTAYLIKNSAAKKFMEETYDIPTKTYSLRPYHTHEADHYLFKCLKTYTYKYPMFIYPTENNSTLHPQDIPSHIRSKKNVERLLKQI